MNSETQQNNFTKSKASLKSSSKTRKDKSKEPKEPAAASKAWGAGAKRPQTTHLVISDKKKTETVPVPSHRVAKPRKQKEEVVTNIQVVTTKPMTDDISEALKKNPKFQALTKKRKPTRYNSPPQEMNEDMEGVADSMFEVAD